MRYLRSQTINVGSFNVTQTYDYDRLNRLDYAWETNPDAAGWKQGFGIDQYGNRWVDESRTRNIAVVPNLTPVSSSWFTSWNNRISGSHDTVGNRSVYAGLNLFYDVENRQVEAKSGATTVATYDYDGEGRRVRKVVNNVETVFVYDAFGQLAQEYGGPAPSFTGRQYLFADHLGSTRAMAPATGTACGWWDFAPYGEKIAGTVNNRFGASGCTYGPSAEPAQQFTGKERDAEAALDYFGARYYGFGQGRWTSPDVVNLTGERLGWPSSTLNKYVYGGNNPLRFVDPDGRDIVALHDHRAPAGHFMLVAYNQKTGDFVVESFGPAQHGDPRMVLPGGAPGQEAYNLPTSLEDLKKSYAALTIQTSPEVAQDAIQAIRERGAGPYQVFTRNCTSACADVLPKVGLINGFLPPDPPGRLWDYLFRRYSPNMKRIPPGAASFFRYGPTPSTPGNDYGSPRQGTGYDGYTFHLLWELMNRPVTGCVSVSDSATGTKSAPECK